MKAHELLAEIDDMLIVDVKNEMFAESLLTQFTNERTNKVNYNDSYSFFLKNFKSDLTCYKAEKHSGHNNIALYKNVAIVGIGDSMGQDGKDIASNLNKTEKWHYSATADFMKILLKKYFKNYWDKRCSSLTLKPTAERFWNQAVSIIFEK